MYLYNRRMTALPPLLQTADEIPALRGHALDNVRFIRETEEAGYISCAKFFEGRVPRTEYRLTDTGRRALEGYLAHMEALIRATSDG